MNYVASAGPPAGSPVAVAGFRLDRFEVTVGRFRKFIEAVDSWVAAGYPKQGDGASPYVADSGWSTSPPWTRSDIVLALHSDGIGGVDLPWTDSQGPDELLPMGWLIWSLAFQFCLWDGGRLPAEVEWAYAAAGGSEQREFPWGNTVPGRDANLAVYGCYYHGTGTCTGINNIAPVGSVPAGDGRWGHADMGGSMWEWVEDFVRIRIYPGRVMRGGSYFDGLNYLRTTATYGWTSSQSGSGVRCARAE
jgi:formylglycine-generating enzyme required for sulfatase activity